MRIGSFGPTSSMRLLPALLARYRQQYPGIEVHIDEGPDEQVLQWLLERRVDIAFAVLPDPASSAARWSRTRWWRCCRRAIAWRIGRG
ncbi:DNA-binding transcriptional regulator CynR [Chromobacterium violaceum]|uniref:DNA-binding transcriptional regulator CynR n=1 Tax=Chromobacterium violaceum TaxID=536 RepID=A0A3S4HR57_CHRVL|nr:DNA-binding transcriptional regulator CynR [Chromobacterium violaceum]